MLNCLEFMEDEMKVLIIAIGNNGLYVLDQRIYKIGKKSRHCIAEIKKIFDGQTLAVYK